jgi:hypothetical protein
MVYAVIYTLFLVGIICYLHAREYLRLRPVFQGFSLTIGSDLYLLVNPGARREYLHPAPPKLSYFHGTLMPMNGTSAGMPVAGTFGFANLTTDAMHHIYKGIKPDFSRILLRSCPIQDASVIRYGPGGNSLSHGGPYFSWFRYTQRALLYPICKTGEAENSTSWFSSLARPTQLTQRRICIYPTAVTLYQL